jgi:hypothetical protein
MKLSTGKLSTGLLFVTLTAGSALAQIPNAIQHVQDQMNAVQQQKKAAGDAALNGPVAAKAPAGKPAAATPSKAAATPAPAKPTTAAAQKAPASPPASQPSKATAKPAVAATSPATSPAKTAPATQAAAPVKHDPFAKTVAPKTSPKPAQPTVAVAKSTSTNTKTAAAKTAEATPAESPAESKDETAEKKKESGYITAGNRRDPFVSPIVQHIGGSGCTTGKRCLAIDQIALRGIVKSDGGMIAVVVNSLDKAYFLRENDPVFNGYVLKISGDSVVFKETVQDKLGHLSTREVVKKITTPAV